MSQTTVQRLNDKGRPGLFGNIWNAISILNNSKQTHQITITAINVTTSIVVNGVLFEVNNPPVAQTKEQLRDVLVTAINNGSEPVTAKNGSATDILIIHADVSGTAWTEGALVNVTSSTLIENEISVPFGVLLTKDLDSGDARMGHLPSLSTHVTAAQSVLGVSVFQQNNQQAEIGSTNAGYKTQSMMDVARSGRGIWVLLDQAVSDGDPAFVRFTGTGQRGAFRKDNDGGNAAALATGRFSGDSITTSDGILTAPLEINLP